MCYQVVERYSVCKCVYYQHAIDPCSRHGERGHHPQEKTTLVGYACSSHGISRAQKKDIQDTEGILDHISDESDDSENDGSIFSTAITTWPATNLIAANGEDTIEEIIQMLIQEPLLQWRELLRSQGAEHRHSGMKDVRFFLRAFESDLRAIAGSAMEIHVCAFFRNRIGYISSRIYKQFNDNNDPITGWTKSDQVRMANALQPKKPEEHDPGNIPPFERIQSFMFDGFPFSALRQNVRNYARNTRNYVKEMGDILTKNVYFIDANTLIAAFQQDIDGDWYRIFNVFFRDLLLEAMNSRISAADMKGINSLDIVDHVKIAVHVGLYWGTIKPTWHHYPLVLGNGSKLQTRALDKTLETSLEFEAFQSFVCSSAAFSNLKVAISNYATRNGIQQSRLLLRLIGPELYLKLRHYWRHIKDEVHVHPRVPGYTPMWFTCSCGKVIYDEYAELTPGGVGRRYRQLETMFIRSKYYEAASSNTETRGMMNIFKGLFSPSTIPTEGASLPRQQCRGFNSGAISQNICTTHPQSDPDNHRYIHWCMPWTRYAMRMHPLQTCQIYSDFDFFTALNARYGNSKSYFRHFLSFKKPIALRFVKFQLYHDQLVDIHKVGTIPPESRREEYDYFPMPAETIPPIGSNLLMHFFTHPEHAAASPVLLPSIPKRKRDKLVPCPIRGSSVGWGIDIRTGTDHLKLFLLGLLACVGSLLFGVIWTVKMRDIQGGFGAAGFMFALLGFAIASLKALDF